MSLAGQEEAGLSIARFRARTLEPAGLPPPGVDPGPAVAEVEGVLGRAKLVRPEAQSWNRWGPEDKPLLFNDSVALLFDVQVQAAGELRWVVEDCWLEVNSPQVRLPAAASAEHVLADLQWYALEQERWLIDGDLVQRTRHAGGFREAFFHPVTDGFAGVIPFALVDPEAHIGALRLRVTVTVDGVPRELVWVFQ